MDNESKYAVRILEALATCNSIFIELAQRVRNRMEVISVTHNLECRKYQSGSFIEGYVDAELHDGNAIAWYLEVEWNDKMWVIESRILVNDAQGQYTLEQFPEKMTVTLDECIEEMLKAAVGLSESLDSVDLVHL